MVQRDLVRHTVVPPLYFGHLSYTPPPGYSGHFPGVPNVPPGYSYRDNLVTARKDALWTNATNPESWQPLSGLGHTLKSKHHDPVLMGTEPDFNPISSHEGLIPGYTGHIPHLNSNGFPGHTYKNLTRNMGAIARTDCRDIAYQTEQRNAYSSAYQEQLNQVSGEFSTDNTGEPAAEDYTAPVELSESEMQHAKAVWLEFHSKMEEHYKLPSVAFRKIDDEHKGYITDVNVKRMLDLQGIRVSPLQLRAIIKGLGCDVRGRVTVMDYRRASELSLPDALETFSGSDRLYSPGGTVRRGGGGGGEPLQEPKRLRLVRSMRSAPTRSMDFDPSSGSFDDLSNMSQSSPNRPKLPVLVFHPRKDPLVEHAIQKNRNKAEGGRHRIKEGSQTDRPTATQLLEGGKRFGKRSTVGYKGHVPQWRNEEWDHIQNQLTLRVKPMMRMDPPRMRSLEDEIDEGSSPQLREAKAAWSLIMENFEEFKKVQTAFRLVDKDFSGIIDRDELRALIENALYIVTSDAAFDIIFRTIDADNSGSISFDEFAAAISDPTIKLTDAVSDDPGVQTQLEKREAIKREKERSKSFDVSATDAFSLYAKNETLRLHDKPFVIQQLRKKVDTKFWEIKNSFAECDPDSTGTISEEDFTRLVRHHLLVPEGGPGQLAAMVNCLLNSDGSVDYLYFCSRFGELGSQVALADPKEHLKAKVDRHFGSATASPSGSPTNENSASLTSGYGVRGVPRNGVRAVPRAQSKQVIQQLTARSMEQAANNPDSACNWQDPRAPGKPCLDVKRKFQQRFAELCKANGVAPVPMADDSPREGADLSGAVKYPLKRIHSTQIDGTSSSWENRPRGAPGAVNGDYMYGVKIGQGASSSMRETKWDNVPGSIVAQAEEAWKMLREASKSAHGSMQRAFRAVDSDGSGRIEMNELRYLIAVHLNIDAEDELLEFIFHCLDRGDKGSITYSEFTSALEGPLSSKPGTTTLELQDHPLDRTFGQSLAAQQPPQMHARDWDKAVSRAAVAGDTVLTRGAANYQLGDRHAWKAMNMYQTSTQRQTQAVKQTVAEASQEPTPRERGDTAGVKTVHDSSGNILEHDISSCSAPTMAAYARQAGVTFVDLSEPSF